MAQAGDSRAVGSANYGLCPEGAAKVTGEPRDSVRGGYEAPRALGVWEKG